MSIPNNGKEIAQIVPPKQLEKLHQLMNFLQCFSSQLGFQEFLTAEEFFVVLEDSYKDPKLAYLADYLASLFVDAFIKDLEQKKLAKPLLQYEYDRNILRVFRDCLRRPSHRSEDLKRSWREILIFLSQTPTFRKLFMFRNPNTGENEEADVESDEGGAAEEEEGEEEDKNSNGMEENNDLNQEEKSQEEEKEIEETHKDTNIDTGVEEKDKQIDSFSLNNCNYQGYESYICKSIQRTDIPFKDFSVEEKLEAFAILIKIAYRLTFSTNLLVSKMKEGTKKNDSKDLKANLDAKVLERETQAKELQKLTDLIESLNERLGSLNDEEERQHRISRQRVGIFKTALEKTDKAIDNIKSQMLVKKREQFFQASNWVSVGVDKSMGQFMVCEYEPNLIFKRIIKESKESYIEEDSNSTSDDDQSCYLYQLGSLEDLKQQLDLSDKDDKQIWEKVVSLKNDKIIEIPEGNAKGSSESSMVSEVEGVEKSDELVNRRRKEIERNLGSRHFGPRTQGLQKQSATTQKSVNSLNTRTSRRLVPETSKRNAQQDDDSDQDSDIEIDKLESFMFKPKQTRSATNIAKRKVIIDDDDNEDEDIDF